MSDKKYLKAALFAAFPFTVPILAGFLFLGMSYGMLMASCRSYFDKKPTLRWVRLGICGNRCRARRYGLRPDPFVAPRHFPYEGNPPDAPSKLKH